MFLSIMLTTFLALYVVLVVSILLYRRWDGCARAPMLDVIMSLLTWIPWVWGSCTGGWWGFLAVVLGQLLVLESFVIIHYLASGYRGPSLTAAQGRVLGFWGNQGGLLLTVPALPIFLALRAGEYLVYPPLVWYCNFPKIKQDEWVTVSRQKFENLVGADLVWCLYCDWMTGVYSLGAEILRNIESFWCPIKFYDGKKCDNCKVDFPDIEEWVEADSTMEDAVKLFEEKYPADSGEPLAWFGSECRDKKCDGCK